VVNHSNIADAQQLPYRAKRHTHTRLAKTALPVTERPRTGTLRKTAQTTVIARNRAQTGFPAITGTLF